MSKCGGLHCPGCGDNGGGSSWLALVVLVSALAVVVRIADAVAKPVEHAASAGARVLITTLEIAGLVLGSVAGLAVLAGLAVTGVRVRRAVLSHTRARARAREVESRARFVAAQSRTALPGSRRAIAGQVIDRRASLPDRHAAG